MKKLAQLLLHTLKGKIRMFEFQELTAQDSPLMN